MKTRVVYTIIGILLSGLVRTQAQSYAEEALFISRIRAGGSARIQAMGGVQNALGGDVSSAYYNPAGLGMYNRSEFSITPGVTMTSYSSEYLGNTTSSNQSMINIPNLGVVFQAGQDGSKGIWSGSLGISFNRINDFNETFSYSGTNNDNSIIDYFIYNADGSPASQFNSNGNNYNSPTGLAYFNYLIGPKNILTPPGPDDEYFSDVTGVPDQSETVKTRGAENQWSLAYGVNFRDKLFIGGGLGITTLTYSSEKTYTERFTDAGQPMTQMTLHETLVLDGTGINFRAGMIYRPATSYQLGFSFATPTTWEIDDSYTSAMTSKWNAFEYQPGVILNNQEASTDNLASTYTLVTPWRLGLGFTYFFGKHGFVSTDVEWMNYGSSKYSGEGDYSGDNEIISDSYKSAFNLRAGGEYRLNKYRFRAGYSLMPDPYQTPQRNVNQAISSLSTGAGYRANKFYIDLAIIYSFGNTSYQPYRLDYALDPVVKQQRKSTSVMVTVGFPF